MQVTVGHLAVPEEHNEPRSLSPVVANVLYFLGLMVETVGIALVPAFGWLVAGTLTALCGVAIAAIGLRHTPDEQSVSHWSMLVRYLVGGWRR